MAELTEPLTEPALGSELDPRRAGMSPHKLDAVHRWMGRKAAGTPYGCLVVRRGRVAAEWYGGGFTAESQFEIGSVRKSFNSALIGIGIVQGIVDLDARAADWWPELLSLSGDPEDAQITLHQLASGTSGWLTPDRPGTVWRYNNAAFTAAERVVARMYCLPNDEIAPEVQRRFKGPLAAESWHVYHFARPFSAAHGNPGPKLAIDSTLRDLAKWGIVWLQDGQWRDQTLIPPEYVKRATRHANPGLPGAHYGYNWFVNAGRALWPSAPEDTYGHPGHGTYKPSGEPSRAYLWVCPSLDLVVAAIVGLAGELGDDYRAAPQAATDDWIGRVVAAVDS